MTDDVKVPAPEAGIKTITPDLNVTREVEPEFVKEVKDTAVIFVPFEDFSGRINQVDFDFRKDVPTKVPKAEANVWLEAKKGYIK